mgnify:CR=1 FL=1
MRGEVRFDDGSRAMYATDSSNYRQVPIGVVLPLDTEDVVETIAACRRFGAPVLPRAGGTSLAGQCCNAAVVIDMSRHMHGIVELDPERRFARVEPGIILDSLRDAAEVYHLTFAADPATHAQCCLGGMIGNNSCGAHSVMGGPTAANIEELEILTYDGLRMRVGPTKDEELERIIAEGGRRGEIYARLRDLRDRYGDLVRERFPNIPRRVSGYNLNELLPENGFNVARALVGAEGTCVTVLEARCRLVPSPRFRSLLVLGYPDVYTAGDHVIQILSHQPIGLEGFDDRLIHDMNRKNLLPENVALLPPGGGWLLVEFGGDSPEEANDRARALMSEVTGAADAPSAKLFDDPKMAQRIWAVRESALGANAHVPGEPFRWEGCEDAAVDPAKLGDYLRDFRALLDSYGYGCDFYGHFGEACIHTRVEFDLVTRDGIRKFREFMDEYTDLVLRYGGSISGEHGDGQARAEFLPKMFGEELVEAFREFKRIWDPDGKMNPGKVVDAYRIDENLRLGESYNPPQYSTYFHYTEDDGSFSKATLRCVGVGKCRRLDGGTMCPSFMATRDETHSTRGRARLLFEMLQGDPLEGGWKNEHVKQALDLCLACKGCKGDCPVSVDMATYKSEFLAHYYEGRLRPVSAYAFGLIFRWARLAEIWPRLANFLTHGPVFGPAFKRVVGLAPQREIPEFAPVTFRRWWRNRPVVNEGCPKVVLWPDTWNNHFLPETSIAAVEVLEAAGRQVLVPLDAPCCGRPLYDQGMLDTAIRQLRGVLRSLKPYIEAGIPVVGLEPSCIATFRDELLGLIPDDENAVRLSRQSFLLSEYLISIGEDVELPQIVRKALVHPHCHHTSVFKFGDEEELLRKIGLDCTILESGCCGMAGAFGYTNDHYQVSMDCGERVLLPAVREASEDTLIITNGFSCREQIRQSTGRVALHLADVLRMAIKPPAKGDD